MRVDRKRKTEGIWGKGKWEYTEILKT